MTDTQGKYPMDQDPDPRGTQDKKGGKKKKLTPEEIIKARLEAGEEFMRMHRFKAERQLNRYLDSSAWHLHNTQWKGDQKPQNLPVGEVNYIAMNIRQKVAGISIANPDWQLDGDTPAALPLVRAYIRKWWHKKKWGRILRRALLSKFIVGLGFVAYCWDRDEGFVLESVLWNDIIVDPHTMDEGWDNPRWAARRIHLPIDMAHERYGEDAFNEAEGTARDRVPSESKDVEKDSYEIWLYYDADTEAEIYGETVLKRSKNLYGKVPIHCLQGDINPYGEFALSDYDTSLGIFEQLRRVGNILNNAASNGGGIPWLRTEYIDERIVENVLNGSHSGYILVSGAPGEQAVGYTPNQALNPAVLEAMKQLSDGLDADQGVTEYDRGVIDENPKFASQAVIMSQRSGGRANLWKAEFENFVEDIVNDFIRCTVKFGLDPEVEDTDDDDVMLWQALSSITDCRVIEESLSVKDPQMKQQQAMQLFQLAISAFPLMNALGEPPNLKKLFDDILRSYDRRDVEDYYLQSGGIQQAQQQGQMQQQQAQQQAAQQQQQYQQTMNTPTIGQGQVQ